MMDRVSAASVSFWNSAVAPVGLEEGVLSSGVAVLFWWSCIAWIAVVRAWVQFRKLQIEGEREPTGRNRDLQNCKRRTIVRLFVTTVVLASATWVSAAGASGMGIDIGEFMSGATLFMNVFGTTVCVAILFTMYALWELVVSPLMGRHLNPLEAFLLPANLLLGKLQKRRSKKSA